MEAVAPSNVRQFEALIEENVPIAERTYRIRLVNADIARSIKPGQFVMVRPGTGFDPLLGRPFAVYDVINDRQGSPCAIDLVYLVIGKGTHCLSQRKAGETLSCWGPLGNGFGDPPRGDVLFVAGGIGQTPFLTLGRWWLGQSEYAGVSFGSNQTSHSVRMLYGVRTAGLAAGLQDFEDAGIPVEVATDDGTLGHHGYVTDLLRNHLRLGHRPAKVIGCGPSPMLKVLTQILDAEGIEGELSLENHMACGFGVCFSCVTPIRQDDGSSDLRRVCVEGPIFPASRVVWE